MGYQAEIKTLSGVLSDINENVLFGDDEKKAIRLAIKVLKEEEAIHKQQERNYKDAIEIAKWCARNSETLERFSQRIMRNIPESQR